MNKQIKVLMSVIVLVLLVQTISASAIATIGMQGLSMASPEAGQIISNVICVSNPIGCLEGKVIGMVQSEALQSLTEQNPEIVQAVMTYNQVQGYVDAGAEITQDLKVNEEGGIEEGVIQFKDKEGRFGNLVGKDIEQKEIYGKEIEFNKRDGTSTISFTGENSYINVKGDLFKDIKAKDYDTVSYLKLDENGDIQEADLTASADTSFVFGEKRIDVKEGTRIYYKDGKINILGKEGDEIDLMDKITDENGDYTFSNSNVIKILDKEGRLSIDGNTIRGTDFQIGDLRVKAESIADLGEVTLVSEGYLLGKKSIGEWKGMNLITDKNLLLATSKNGLENYDSWVLPDTKRLQARGGGFEILFNKGNKWANMDYSDTFAIKTGEGFELDIQNRDNEGLIPKMEVGGDFIIDVDNKGIYTKDGKILINKNALFSKSDYLDRSTSPVELLIKDKNGAIRKEKYIINNFKGIATVPVDASEGFSDIRYGKSIYKVRAKIDNRYNYPTIKDFEKISGKKVIYFGDTDWQGNPEPIPPEDLRKLIDYYETLPEESRQKLQKIEVYDTLLSNSELKEQGFARSTGGQYIFSEGILKLKTDVSIDTFRHESAHNYHDLRLVDEEVIEQYYLNRRNIMDERENLRLDFLEYAEKEKIDFSKGVEILPKERQIQVLKIDELKKEMEENNPLFNPKLDPFNEVWIDAAGGKEVYDKYGDYDSDGFIIWKGERSSLFSELRPDYGFVGPYGGTEYSEDITTYIGKIVGNPIFFKENNLIGEGADPRYKQKIDLLLKYDFITDKEHDAVFNPEKYGFGINN